MSVFERYAPFYDLVYRERDVGREVNFVRQVCARHGIEPTSVLDLGCGTGAHLEIFSRLGWRAAGVEQSEAMLARARQRMPGNAVRFVHADATQVELGERFDVVVGLFHVLSYQVEDAQLLALLRTAARHAACGVLFDFWYAPAVIAIGPERREVELENEGVKVTRIANPRLDAARRVVDVELELVAEHASGIREQFSELHRMRCFEAEEIASFCRQAGLELCELSSWLGTSAPTTADWSAFVLAKPTRD